MLFWPVFVDFVVPASQGAGKAARPGCTTGLNGKGEAMDMYIRHRWVPYSYYRHKGSKRLARTFVTSKQENIFLLAYRQARESHPYALFLYLMGEIPFEWAGKRGYRLLDNGNFDYCLFDGDGRELSIIWTFFVAAIFSFFVLKTVVEFFISFY